ncbi:MAG: hypothetical protein R3F59_00330 [Myxococcota bacterium]
MRCWTLLLAACAGGEAVDTATPSPTSSTADPTITWDRYATIEPNFSMVDEDFEGRRLTTAIPDDPVALLFVFHGANGDVTTVTQIEWIELYDLLVPQGVGLVLTVSLDAEGGMWDQSESPDNPDFQRLVRVRDHVIETSAATADTPVLALGFSHGAGFAPVFATLGHDAGWDVRGFDAHNSPSIHPMAVPGFFVSAENDEQSGTPDRVGEVAAECEAWTGEDCPHRVGHEILLDPRRFARLPAYGEAASQAIFDELVGMGFVDDSGARLVDLQAEGVDALMDAYIRTSQLPSPTLPPTQLRVVWATHRCSSEHAVEEAAWLLGRVR